MAEPTQSVKNEESPPEQENQLKNAVSPMIEIPTRSHGRLSTITVTFVEFCKIPVQYFQNPETDDIVHSTSLNNPFCPQIHDGGKSEVGGGVQLRPRSGKKLPTQVAYDSEGNIRTDFPFDSRMPLSDLKQLNETTMTAPAIHRKKKLLVDYEEESSQTGGDDSSASYVFGVKVNVSSDGRVTLLDGNQLVTDHDGSGVSGDSHAAGVEGNQVVADHDGSAELFSQNSDGDFVPDTDLSQAQQEQVDADGVSKIDETDLDEQNGDALKVADESTVDDTNEDVCTTVEPTVTSESTLEDTKEDSGDTLKVTGERTLEDSKDDHSGDTSTVTGNSTVEKPKDDHSGDTSTVTGNSTVEKPKDDHSGDTSTVTGESTVEKPKHVEERPYKCKYCDHRFPTLDVLDIHVQSRHHSKGVQYSDYKHTGDTTVDPGDVHDDSEDKHTGDTTVDPGDVDAEKSNKDSDDATLETPKQVGNQTDEGNSHKNNVSGKENSHVSMHSKDTLMVNGRGTGGENQVTITVHSDVKGVVGSITKKFRDYTKGLKNMKVQLTSSPIVTLSRPDTSEEPTKRKLGMTSSVTKDETTGKKIKIYVDEDLILERQMIELMAKTGQEMCK